MRAPTALTAAALATATALLLTACGGGGSDGTSDTIDGVPTTAPSAAATTAAPTAAPLTIDPSLALPADLKLNFDWPRPSDHTQAVALAATANFMQSLVHGVVKQSVTKSGLANYATDSALVYGKSYVQRHVDAKSTLTGTDHYYRPVIKVAANKTSAEVTFCNNQAKLYSKAIPTGKVAVTPENNESYRFYDIVLIKFRPNVDLWQAASIEVKESALQCKQ
ncbi:hypothetical protein G3I60_13940 [Streptomyces sp. SID13666]|uniref:hypothetical protein n=1 Tax=unclassified Streptomyces TaxID=2593676 RepID=UPI0013C1135C|nr:MULTISPECIES: hypothetical protein [unclassified Streptomyces]NEA55220.1 hypothetical protein [Streptomyces sp. SID13666]NEA76422.1 hypothetical protein [Streptomyces sp. SID13588]